MFKLRFMSAFVAAALLAGCSDSDDSPSAPQNQAPEVSLASQSVPEKASASYTATVTLDEGATASYQWTQVSGPELTLTGADSNEVSFTAPSVAVDTSFSLSLTVTDSNGMSTTATLSEQITRIDTDYSVSGDVLSEQLYNQAINAKVAGDSASGTIGDDGSFNLTLSVDDDTPLNRAITVTAGDEASLQLLSLIPAISQLSEAEGASSAIAKAYQPLSGNRALATADADGTTTVSVSSVSTALYSLILAANGGEEPENLEEIQFIESQVDPEQLVQMAAVVEIILSSEEPLLEDGEDLVSVLAESEAYESVIETINEADPTLIDDTVTQIVEDPELTPPPTANDIPPVYYQTSPVAESFIARNGTRYEFDTDGSGRTLDRGGNFEFEWQLNDGKLLIEFTAPKTSLTWINIDSPKLGLTQEQIALLRAYEYSSLQAEYQVSSQTLTRITSGTSLDSFTVDTVANIVVAPVTLGEMTIEVTPYADMSTSNELMRKNAASSDGFTVDMATGTLGLEIYKADTNYSNYFELVTLSADGSGMIDSSEESFTWAIEDTVLVLSFDSFTQTFTIVNQVGNGFEIYSEVMDKEGKFTIAMIGFGATSDDNQFTAANISNEEGHYFQTMVNAWFTTAWDGERLRYCYDEENCDHTDVGFGFEFNDDGTGLNHNYFKGLPPNASSMYGNTTSWALEDDTLSINYLNKCSNSDGICLKREWQLIYSQPGRLGDRIYVRENYQRRDSVESDWYYLIDPRWNVYEEIALDYFNTSVDSGDIDLSQYLWYQDDWSDEHEMPTSLSSETEYGYVVAATIQELGEDAQVKTLTFDDDNSVTLYEEDGSVTFNLDGTGSYIDTDDEGQETESGEFTWSVDENGMFALVDGEYSETFYLFKGSMEGDWDYVSIHFSANEGQWYDPEDEQIKPVPDGYGEIWIEQWSDSDIVDLSMYLWYEDEWSDEFDMPMSLSSRKIFDYTVDAAIEALGASAQIKTLPFGDDGSYTLQEVRDDNPGTVVFNSDGSGSYTDESGEDSGTFIWSVADGLFTVTVAEEGYQEIFALFDLGDDNVRGTYFSSGDGEWYNPESKAVEAVPEGYGEIWVDSWMVE